MADIHHPGTRASTRMKPFRLMSIPVAAAIIGLTLAFSSRAAENRQIGLERMRAAGASLTSVETALFELLRAAEGEKFKQITKIVK